jgi:hypothetical protein
MTAAAAPGPVWAKVGPSGRSRLAACALPRGQAGSHGFGDAFFEGLTTRPQLEPGQADGERDDQQGKDDGDAGSELHGSARLGASRR